jgi:type VI secretion system secreted protein Hcp
VSTADAFLTVPDVTGDVAVQSFKGSIEVLSWTWRLSAPTDLVGGLGKAVVDEVQIVKRADRSTTGLMTLIASNQQLTEKEVVLSIRRGASETSGYYELRLFNARITSLTTSYEDTEIRERVTIAFDRVRVIFTPIAQEGAAEMICEIDAYSGRVSN